MTDEADRYMQQLGMKPGKAKPGKRGFVKHEDGSVTLPGKKRERYFSMWIPRWLHIEIEYRAKKANIPKSEWLAQQLGIAKPV